MDVKRELKERKLARKKWKEKKVMKFLSKTVSQEAEPVVNEHREGRMKLDEENGRDNSPQKYTPGRTLSIAVPGSILENAQSPELRTYLAGQIARAVCIFKIDEVVVFDDLAEEDTTLDFNETDFKEIRSSCAQLARILQYLECPQYLRKQLFPLHKDLQFAGVLNPLDAPHHLRQNDHSIYREGVVVKRPVKHQGSASYVNVGLGRDVFVECALPPGMRVTVKLEEEGDSEGKLRGSVVPPWQPKAHLGTYWGYQVRLASSLKAALSECPFPGQQYSLTIGTSDKGTVHIPERLPHAKHVLVMFGGVQGLEAALENNGGILLREAGGDASLLFDYYFNTCPQQGSRTIRTEEAILISLSVLLPRLAFC
ncbi:hypothetical protein J437_LFUL016277 [Ladona fulva]|uniref:Uncharacterized protein n=1 Tax=Ladona fulva TaxID=123851 RepID=A0A8K0P4T9_LADFU|nr:hypothetical protein J437_LFUL016277 [Ladona fulva]